VYPTVLLVVADAADLRNDVQVNGIPVHRYARAMPRVRLTEHAAEASQRLLHEYLHGARGGVNADGLSATTVRNADPSAVDLPVSGFPTQLSD
jgi:hypothetical protein